MIRKAEIGEPGLRTSTLLIVRASLVGLFVALCACPWLLRLAHPSIFADDMQRIAQVRTMPFGRLLIAPFNEHIAPLFQLVTYSAWEISGGRLTAAALALTIASLVPFVLVNGLLFLVLRKELKDALSAYLGTTVFCLSGVYSEAVYWYSGSSFCWSLAAALAGIAAAGEYARSGKPRWMWIAGLMGLAAPLFSAIGILAAPAAAIRALAGDETAGGGMKRRLKAATVALLGLMVFLAVYALIRSRLPQADLAKTRLDLAYGLWFVVRGPMEVLLPEVLRLRGVRVSAHSAAPGAVGLALLLGSLGLAWKSRSGARSLILAGLWFIIAGYLLTFSTRPDYEKLWALTMVKRYHLFPQVGCACLLAGLCERLAPCRRLGASRVLPAGCALAGLLWLLHADEFRRGARHFEFDGQRETLAAIERLDQARIRLGIARSDAIGSLDPIRTRWAPFPVGGHALTLLSGSGPAPEGPSRTVRDRLLQSLAPADIERVCAGMEVSVHARDLARSAAAPAAQGELIRAIGMAQSEAPRAGYRAKGYTAFLEYEFRDVAGSVCTVILPEAQGDDPWELWWTTREGSWSQARSVVFRPVARDDLKVAEWEFATAEAPHWRIAAPEQPAQTLRIRLIARSKGWIAADPPKLLR